MEDFVEWNVEKIVKIFLNRNRKERISLSRSVFYEKIEKKKNPKHSRYH